MRASQAREIVSRFEEKYPMVAGRVGRRAIVEELSLGGVTLYSVQGKPIVFDKDGVLYPTLFYSEVLDSLPRVIVDMGAIAPICNGADVMAPGVRGVVGSFGEGSLVGVLDQRFNKAIAIGLAIISSDALKGASHGKVVKNIHHVGDKIWEVAKAITTN